ncbi:MAG TPA: PilZ domain-containing protein [Candidatus Acidoferrales bacterium]|jgi:hypothetical protein|nr:PilZ domain-containing protein [Candidatus Acidoferrales bacterium]
MSNHNGFDATAAVGRSNSRVHCLREINLTYEGQNEHTVVKAPDLSANGMFISTSRRFPEGAILNLQFRMAITDAVVETRCEVRYCLPGVGVGVEFVGITPEAKRYIERELKLALGDAPAQRRVPKKARARRRARRS